MKKKRMKVGDWVEYKYKDCKHVFIGVVARVGLGDPDVVPTDPRDPGFCCTSANIGPECIIRVHSRKSIRFGKK